MTNQNHGGQPHPSAFQFQHPPQNVHGGGYDPHRFPRQLPTLGQFFPRQLPTLGHQRTQPSQQHNNQRDDRPPRQHYPLTFQQPTYIHFDPTQERQVYPTVFNPAMAQPPPPQDLTPGMEYQGPLILDPQQPIYGYYDFQGNFYPDRPTTSYFLAMAQSQQQQQQLTVYPDQQLPQDATPAIEQHEPLVQDPQPSILSPSTTTTTIVVPAPSMYDPIIASPREFFDSQDVIDAINILRMNLDIIYELRRKYHGNVSISTSPINALSEKSELTLVHVTVNILEAVLREAECPGATFSRIPLKKLLEDYGIPESHRSFVEKFLMERDMKYWSYLVFMSIYFDLSPLPPKL